MLAPVSNGHISEPAGRSIYRSVFETQLTLTVVVIGAGASHPLLAYKLHRQFGNQDL